MVFVRDVYACLVDVRRYLLQNETKTQQEMCLCLCVYVCVYDCIDQFRRWFSNKNTCGHVEMSHTNHFRCGRLFTSCHPACNTLAHTHNTRSMNTKNKCIWEYVALSVFLHTRLTFTINMVYDVPVWSSAYVNDHFAPRLLLLEVWKRWWWLLANFYTIVRSIFV